MPAVVIRYCRQFLILLSFAINDQWTRTIPQISVTCSSYEWDSSLFVDSPPPPSLSREALPWQRVQSHFSLSPWRNGTWCKCANVNSACMKRIITFSTATDPIVFTAVGCTLNALNLMHRLFSHCALCELERRHFYLCQAPFIVLIKRNKFRFSNGGFDHWISRFLCRLFYFIVILFDHTLVQLYWIFAA